MRTFLAHFLCIACALFGAKMSTCMLDVVFNRSTFWRQKVRKKCAKTCAKTKTTKDIQGGPTVRHMTKYEPKRPTNDQERHNTIFHTCTHNARGGLWHCVCMCEKWFCAFLGRLWAVWVHIWPHGVVLGHSGRELVIFCLYAFFVRISCALLRRT